MKIYPIVTESVYVDSRDQQQRDLVKTHQTATQLSLITLPPQYRN